MYSLHVQVGTSCRVSYSGGKQWDIHHSPTFLGLHVNCLHHRHEVTTHPKTLFLNVALWWTCGKRVGTASPGAVMNTHVPTLHSEEPSGHTKWYHECVRDNEEQLYHTFIWAPNNETIVLLLPALSPSTFPYGGDPAAWSLMTFTPDKGDEMPGYWITTMKKLGGRAGGNHTKTSSHVYPWVLR